MVETKCRCGFKAVPLSINEVENSYLCIVVLSGERYLRSYGGTTWWEGC